MFTHEDCTGERLTVTLGPPTGPDEPPTHAWFCASNHIGIRVYTLMDAPGLRRMITELAAMADEIETAGLEVEVAEAARQQARESSACGQ
jgi:hypothetical protein